MLRTRIGNSPAFSAKLRLVKFLIMRIVKCYPLAGFGGFFFYEKEDCVLGTSKDLEDFFLHEDDYHCNDNSFEGPLNLKKKRKESDHEIERLSCNLFF